MSRGGAATLPVLGSSWVALQRGGRGLHDEEGPLNGEGSVTQWCTPAFTVRVVKVVARMGGVACWRLAARQPCVAAVVSWLRARRYAARLCSMA